MNVTDRAACAVAAVCCGWGLFVQGWWYVATVYGLAALWWALAGGRQRGGEP